MRDENQRKCFRDVVWPVIGPHIGGGELLVVEDNPDPLYWALDCISGFDAIQRFDDICQCRGLAVRIQPQNSFETFTIRSLVPSGRDTEYQKRMFASVTYEDRGYMYPALMIHAYVARGYLAPVHAVAAARTRDIYLALASGAVKYEVHEVPDREDPSRGSNYMRSVYWSDLVKAGVDVTIVRPDTKEKP